MWLIDHFIELQTFKPTLIYSLLTNCLMCEMYVCNTITKVGVMVGGRVIMSVRMWMGGGVMRRGGFRR